MLLTTPAFALHFHCTDTYLEVANSTTAWTSEFEQGQKILVPAKHGEGRFQAGDDDIARLVPCGHRRASVTRR